MAHLRSSGVHGACLKPCIRCSFQTKHGSHGCGSPQPRNRTAAAGDHDSGPTNPSELRAGEVTRTRFQNIPGVRGVTRQGGAGDHGADLIVEYGGGIPHPALRTQHICVVQAKSYEGSHLNTRAVRDIERAFAVYPTADRGLIVSTASSSTKELDDAVEKLRQSSGKQVQLLIGADVARFILQFGGPIFGEAATNANGIPADG
ncbi:hypothetical protein ACVIW2_000186 [Bradyrhizobium huanghuaihaiense]